MNKTKSFLFSVLSVFVLVAVVLLVGTSYARGRASSATRPSSTILLPFLADQTIPPNSFEVNVIPVTDSTDSFTDIVPLGDGRLLIVAKSGTILMMHDDHSIDPTPFLDLTGEVYNGENESGLFAITPHPDVANNHYFFVNYSRLNADSTGYEVVITRYTANLSHSMADPASREDIMIIPKSNPTHNGGSLVFGPNDGYLYISVGDDNNDPDAQNLTVLPGKILRIDVDKGLPYTIPSDNPFAGSGGARTKGEIWSYGFRNPWRMRFDSVGNMYIADVGHLSWEEINYEPADDPGGRDYGWPCQEGNVPFDESACSDTPSTKPIHTYAHSNSNCSITGGIVYTGSQVWWWQDEYIFTDFCSAELKSLWLHPEGHWITQHLGTLPASDLPTFTSTIAADENGELYLGLFNNTNIIQIVPPLPFPEREK